MAIMSNRRFTQAMTMAVVAALLLAASPGTFLNPPIVGAAQWMVSSLADDGSPGTLRHCIDNAAEGDTIKFRSGLHGTITLDPVLGPLEIVEPVTIEGPGADVVAVDGGNQTRVLVIAVGSAAPPGGPEDVQELAPGVGEDAEVVISGLTFQNGFADSEAEPYTMRPGGNILVVGSDAALIDCVIEGGEAEIGGGIGVLVAYLSLDGCEVTNNVATDNSGEAFAGVGGGLLAFLAYVEARNCVFEDNVAEDDELRPGGGGAMSLFLALCWLDGCTVKGNVAGNGDAGGMGGGILSMFNIMLLFDECSIESNSVTSGSDELGGGLGGGVAVVASGVTDVENCLLADNVVVAGGSGATFGAGGGIAFLSVTDVEAPDFLEAEALPLLMGRIPPVMVNCTLSGNSVEATDESGLGGGIWSAGVAPEISFCTITDNAADFGGGLSTFPVAAFSTPEPGPPMNFVVLKNSIVANNDAVGDSDDIWGFVSSEGGNIFGDQDGWSYVAAPWSDCGDLLSVDPRMGPLADNGGLTRTHALLPGSPALDAACGCMVNQLTLTALDAEYEPGSSEVVNDRDQRGLPRPVDGDGDGEAGCDIGAFEAQPDIVLVGGSGEGGPAPKAVAGRCTMVYLTVTNEGDAPLLIESVELSGGDAGEFSLVDDPSGIILDPGESTELTYRFCPRTQGERHATVRVFSTDPDEPAVELDLQLMVNAGGEDRESEPARMMTSYLNVDPMQVLPGQQVTVSANVCNSGGERGAYTAALAVNGTAEQSQSVAVSADACKQVVFVVVKAVPGNYSVSVEGMQGQFTVLSPRVVQASTPSQQEMGLGTAGIIAIVVIVVVLILALVVVFRRE